MDSEEKATSSFDREPMWKMNKPVDEPLSKRERSAMAAMQGVLSSPDSIPSIIEAYKQAGLSYEPEDVSAIVVKDAVNHADALLNELEETK